MIHEIPIKQIPSNQSKKGVLTRIPFVKSAQKLCPRDIISTNYYLQIVVYILYFVKIPEFPVSISLPYGTKLAELPFLPMVQALKDLFDFHRAVVDDNSTVSQIKVRGLLPDVVKVVEELDESNKIDPLLKELFMIPQPRPNQSNLAKAYIIEQNKTSMQNYLLSNFQQYLLWECMRNNGIFGLPIGTLSINDLEEESFQKLIQVFDATYVVGSGNPWLASHLIVAK